MAAWDNAVVTNAGKAMLAGLFPGEKPCLDWASGGAGTVPPLALMAQMAIADERQTYPIVSVAEEVSGKKIGILISGQGLITGYTVKQIGIWAHAGDDPPVLFAILQDSTGIQVYSESEFPDFAVNFYAILGFSNETDFTLSVVTTALVSQGALIDALNAFSGTVWTRDIMRRVNYRYPLDPTDYIYVATTGSDTTGDGTEGNPYATLGKAIDVAAMYTSDSYKRINLAAGDYYESDGLLLRGLSNVLIYGASAATTKVHFTGSVNSNGLSVEACTYVKLSSIGFLCDYVLPTNAVFLSFVNTTYFIEMCDIKSSVIQTNTGTRAIYAMTNSKGRLWSDASVAIDGFHIGIGAYDNVDITTRYSGEAITTAYSSSNGSEIKVSTAVPPILAPTPFIAEADNSKVRFSHLQGVNNTIYIYADAVNGDDRNWGQSGYPVKTLARARDIAQRCEGTGSIYIQLADGVYDLPAAAQSTGISRNIRIQGNTTDKTAVEIRINHGGSGLVFWSCGYITVNYVKIRRTVTAPAGAYMLQFVSSNHAVTNCDFTADTPETYQYSSAIQSYQSQGNYNTLNITNLGLGLDVCNGGIGTAYNVTGSNNLYGYRAGGGLIMKSSHTLSATVPFSKADGGVIFDNGVMV